MNNSSLEIEEILDNEDLVNDSKTSSGQLSKYFNETKNIKSLIDFIIIEPTEEEHKRGHKYPFNACELLCSENSGIIKGVFVEEQVQESEDEEYKKKADEEEFNPELDAKLIQIAK